MRKIGKVINFTAGGSIVVKSDITPPVGGHVYNQRSKPVGRIVRVTGPVSAPYAIIDPATGMGSSISKIMGQDLFVGNSLNTGKGVSRKMGKERKVRSKKKNNENRYDRKSKKSYSRAQAQVSQRKNVNRRRKR